MTTQPTLTHYAGTDTSESDTSSNRLAVWSLVLGALGLTLLGPFAAIPGVIVGYKARTAVTDGRATNAAMARAGLVLSWIATLVSTALTVYLLVKGIPS